MQVSTKLFDYDSKTKSFSAEISTLEGKYGPCFHRIYNDACDLGLILVSAKTGVETKWAIDDEKRDDKGDLMYWKLVPTAETKRKVPAVRDCTMIVFND